MFAFNRSAFAVLLPLALLLAVVMFTATQDSGLSAEDHSAASTQDHTVAANLPSR